MSEHENPPAEPETGEPVPAAPPMSEPAAAEPAEQDEDDVRTAMFSGSPAKVMRIGTMIKQLLDEVRSSPLDAAARARLVEMHERSLHELEDGLSEDLVDELRRITLPFDDDAEPSDAELRIAQAQLVGWLEGLFHGLQTALVAQQMQTQAQLAQMRRALPPGTIPPPGMIIRPGGAEQREERPPGHYL